MFPPVAQLTDLVTALGQRDLGDLADADLDTAVRQLGRLATLIEAESLRHAGEGERRKVWMRDGSRSARACLSRRWGTTVHAAGERLLLAARLREAPATRAAFAAGDLSYGKARALCTAVAEAVPDRAKRAFRESESVLVTSATSLSEHQVREVMTFWHHHADPDGARERDAGRYGRRGLSVIETFDGMVHIEGCLTAEQGQVVLRVLRAIESRFWRADHRATERDHTCDDGAAPRTDRQRCADATVEAFRLAGQYDPTTDTFDGRGATPPRVAAVVELDRTTGTPTGGLLADSHQPLTGDAARRMACDSVISAVTLDERQVPLSVTHGKGQVSAGLRAAVVLRDGACAFPGCAVPPRCCDVHHATWRSAGGHHRLDNTLLLCHHHHRLQHEGRWQCDIAADTGRPRFRHPDGTWHAPDPSPPELAAHALDPLGAHAPPRPPPVPTR
jgi:hypothetical protein